MDERLARLQALPGAPLALAGLVWALCSLTGLLVRAHVGSHALDAGVQVLPLVAGVAVAVLAAWLLTRRRVGPLTAWLLLGALAGLVSFSLLVILAGTPYGIGSVYGDCGRTVAAAERFRLSPGSHDQFIAGLPAQYPPLWFWLWGRAAALLARDAYQVQGVVQALGLGVLPLAAGAAWRRVVSWQRAAAVTAVTYAALVVGLSYDPCKGHEISAALLSLPALLLAHVTVLAVLSGRTALPRAVLAGVALGLAFLLYQLFVVFSLPALLVLWAVRARQARRVPALLAHLAVTAVTALVVTSWYVLPVLSHALRGHAPRAADPLMVFFTLRTVPGLPVDVGMVLAVVVLTGGLLLALRPREPLSQAMLAIVASSLAVQLVGLLSIAAGGESFYSYRTQPWLVVVCSAAAALLLPGALRRLLASAPPLLASTDRRRASAVLLAVVLLVGVHRTWDSWHAPSLGTEVATGQYAEAAADAAPNGTVRAYLAPLPTCHNVAGLPRTERANSCYPGVDVQHCIERAYGDDARPVLVAYDDRAAAFFGDHLYLGTNGGATGPFDEWEQRYDVVRRLGSQHDPAAFLQAVRATPYGPVDGFVLAAQRSGTWRFVAQTYHDKAVVDFSPSVFATPDWQVCRYGVTVVALRRR